MGNGYELTDIDLAAAKTSQDECAALLARIAAVPTPGLSPALLSVFVELASPSCTWLDGDLAVELFEEEEVTRVRVLSELGGGFRESVLGPLTLPSTLDDIASEIEELPELLGPLRLERISSRCALLVSADDAPSSVEFDISETSLSPLARPASDVDDGWD